MKKGKDLNRSNDSGPCSIWEHIDMFKEPIETLQYDGSKYIRSSFGGIMSLLTVLIFCLCMMLKISSVVDQADSEAEYGSEPEPVKRRLSLARGDQWFSDKNFKWTETT